MFWNGIIIDTMDKFLVDIIDWTHFRKDIEITDYYMDKYVNPHIIREEGLEKWSIVITS